MTHSNDDRGLAPVRYLRVPAARAEAASPESPTAEFASAGAAGAPPAAGDSRAAELPAPIAIRGERGDDEPVAPFAPIEEHSLRALGRRGLSRRELARRLSEAGYEADAVEAELDRLEATGLLDDDALAQHLVGVLQERKGLGRSAIAAELARRVLAPRAIEYALDLIDSGEELAMARELAAKRMRSLSGLDAVTRERRLSAYLARRGYSGSTVRAAVESVRPSA